MRVDFRVLGCWVSVFRILCGLGVRAVGSDSWTQCSGRVLGRNSAARRTKMAPRTIFENVRCPAHLISYRSLEHRRAGGGGGVQALVTKPL